jgi:hypothetical protein
MEHLRVVVLSAAGIEEAITGLGRQIASLGATRHLLGTRRVPTPESDRLEGRVAACQDARTTLAEALEHPVHPPGRHKEATL